MSYALEEAQADLLYHAPASRVGANALRLAWSGCVRPREPVDPAAAFATDGVFHVGSLVHAPSERWPEGVRECGTRGAGAACRRAIHMRAPEWAWEPVPGMK